MNNNAHAESLQETKPRENSDQTRQMTAVACTNVQAAAASSASMFVFSSLQRRQQSKPVITNIYLDAILCGEYGECRRRRHRR